MVNGLKEWISGRQLKQMAAKDRQIWLQIPDILTTQPDGKKIAFSSNRNNGGTRDTNVFVAKWKD